MKKKRVWDGPLFKEAALAKRRKKEQDEQERLQFQQPLIKHQNYLIKE
jgi:hypothetical protein